MHMIESELSPVTRAHDATGSSEFPGGEFLTVHIGAETYAFEILKVQEIRSFTEPTRIAGSGPGTLGVINLRGVIVPIVDSRMLLGVHAAHRQAAPVVVVLTFGHRTVGVLVDAVCEVVEFARSDLRPAPCMGSDTAIDHVMGIVSLSDASEGAGRLCIVTDVEKLVRSALREREDISNPTLQ